MESIDHVALAVRDVTASAEWYRRVLGLERVHPDVWDDIPTMMAAGRTSVALFPVRGENPQPTPGKDVLTMRHLAFRASPGGFTRAQEHLTAENITFTFQDHGISHSIYFFDPDGHEIEITTYELEPECPSP